MMWRWVLAAVVTMGVGVVGGLAAGEEPATGPATEPAIVPATSEPAATSAATSAAATAGAPSYPVGSGGARIVYVIDHSASTGDSFDFVRREVVRSVRKMIPAQRFAVVLYADTVDQTYPKDGLLVPGIADFKRELEAWLAPVKAEGGKDGLLDPAVAAFKRALAMEPRPQVVYFLTQGHFDAKLVEEVAKLNADKKVKVYTIAFVKISMEAEGNMKKIAQDNGGKYKFVSEKDLEVGTTDKP